MSSGWFKLWKDMISDPRLLQAATQLKSRYHLGVRTSAMGGEDLDPTAALYFWRNALLGGLATLWGYADDYIREDDTLPIGSEAIDAMVGIEGFCQLMPDDWIVELDDGAVQLPGYCRKNNLISQRKRTADSKVRQARWRANHPEHRRGNHVDNAAHNASVTRNATQGKREGDALLFASDSDSDSSIRTPPTPSATEGARTAKRPRNGKRAKNLRRLAELTAGITKTPK